MTKTACQANRYAKFMFLDCRTEQAAKEAEYLDSVRRQPNDLAVLVRRAKLDLGTRTVIFAKHGTLIFQNRRYNVAVACERTQFDESNVECGDAVTRESFVRDAKGPYIAGFVAPPVPPSVPSRRRRVG